MKPFIQIRPSGNMGNQMLQYMFALNLKRLVNIELDIFGYDIPHWDMKNLRSPTTVPARLRLAGQYVDVRQMVELMNSGIVKYARLNGLGFQLSNYAEPSFYNDVFQARNIETKVFGSDQVVINIRGAEILGNVHPDYGPVPFRYIDSVIENSNASPVFLGQIGDDVYSQRLRQRYSRAEFHPSQGPIKDFETLRRSSEISVSVSTFSWLAAWLSSARTIHYPLSGILDPRQRPDIDLTPVTDARYKFYQIEPRRWSASEEDFENLWAEGYCPVVNRQTLIDTRDIARETTRTTRIVKRLKTSGRAYAAYALNILRGQ